MPGIRAGLERSDNHGSPCAAELCRCYAGLHTEFINRVSRRKENNCINQGFVVVNSVENIIIRLRTKPVHGKRSAASLSVSECLRVAARTSGLPRGHTAGHAGNQRRELCKVAAVKRQFGHLAALDHFTDRRVCQIDHRRTSLHGNRFCDLSHTQPKIRDGDLRDLQIKFAYRFPEARLSNCHAIMARWQGRHRIEASLVGRHRSFPPRADIGHRDRGAHNRGILRVGNRALQTCGIGLCETECRRSEERQ